MDVTSAGEKWVTTVEAAATTHKSVGSSTESRAGLRRHRPTDRRTVLRVRLSAKSRRRSAHPSTLVLILAGIYERTQCLHVFIDD